MLLLAARRLASMLLIMAVVSFMLFTIFESDKLGVAGKVLGPYSSTEQRELWLEQNGYNRPFLVRYVEWVGNALRGDFGEFDPLQDAGQRRCSGTVSATPASWRLCVFAIMIPLSLVLGVLSGMREGSGLDRTISFISILTTSVPEFASATLPRGPVRVQARLAARHLGDDRRLQPGRAGPAGGGAGPLRFRLRRPDDPRLDGRGDDLAVHPHRHAQGSAAPAGDRHATPCATR